MAKWKCDKCKKSFFGLESFADHKCKRTKKIKINLDEQVILDDGSNWIFERSEWPGCKKATKLIKNNEDEFVIDEIHETNIVALIDFIKESTGSRIYF